MKCLLIATTVLISYGSYGQVKNNDVNTPLHAMKPDYKITYGIPVSENVKAVLKRVFDYLNVVTPAAFADKRTNIVVTDLSKIDTNTIFQAADFRLTSYEWGVTYAGMLLAGEATGDAAYTEYTTQRLHLIADALPAFTKLYAQYPRPSNPMRQPVAPHALDDGGAVCAAMIKTLQLSGNKNLRPAIDHYIDYITNKEFRLKDGVLARNRPQKNTLWLDDMYMGIPAIAQMGKLTGEKKYFDDAIKQVTGFSQRMFNKNLGVYMHGWVQEMSVHPEFHWARANGWAMLSMVELLDVLPAGYPGRELVLQQLNAQVKGIASYQSGEGFWHQLLDRTDSYLETSATAIYTYCIARAINKGWIDAKAYAPVCMLGWNAVSAKVTNSGQVEGVCVGTGMAFDPAFYYYRPVNVYAAHGYGPVLLAGAEILNLLKNFTFEINDSSLQLKEKNSQVINRR
jgi:unsaturated rhamnogalacturonyl hydrolase